MKKSEAIQYLNYMVSAIQKFRSNAALEIGEEQILKDMMPWVFGNKCPLPILVKAVDSDNITPHDFYNFMYIFDKFMPEVKVTYEALNKINFPIPDINIIVNGWDNE